MAEAESTSAKVAAQETMSALPETASWEEVMYALYVRESIEAGLRDVAAGRVVSHQEAVRRLKRLRVEE